MANNLEYEPELKAKGRTPIFKGGRGIAKTYTLPADPKEFEKANEQILAVIEKFKVKK